uniref:Putative ovule protein n=1 Tax=Solanum chacoense TaxID=4108 RepID=A0A0V0H9K7_SOLCH
MHGVQERARQMVYCMQPYPHFCKRLFSQLEHVTPAHMAARLPVTPRFPFHHLIVCGFTKPHYWIGRAPSV